MPTPNDHHPLIVEGTETGPTSLPHKKHPQTPTLTFRTTRRCDNPTSPSRTIRGRGEPSTSVSNDMRGARSPTPQRPPVERHEADERRRVERYGAIAPKPTIRATRWRRNPNTHESSDTKVKQHEAMEDLPPTSNHTAMDGYWSRASWLCTGCF